jgi:hypothetical protein
MCDIKEVIEKYGIEDEDIVIKLTGRYRVDTQRFFEDIIKNINEFDAFVKFYGACSLKYEMYDCILGLYALRAKYFKLFNQYNIENYNLLLKKNDDLQNEIYKLKDELLEKDKIIILMLLILIVKEKIERRNIKTT